MKESMEVPSGSFEGNVEEQMIPGTSDGTDLAAKKRVKRSERKNADGTRKRVRKKRKETPTAVLIKYTALFLLVAQMVGLVLLMRVSRTSHPEGEPMYLASTAVFVMELMKLGICCCVIAYQSETNLLSELRTHVLQSPVEMAKLSVPSFMYTVQNNLLYFALTNLDAATYQVCYQLKILTTAVFSMVLLQVSSTFCLACVNLVASFIGTHLHDIIKLNHRFSVHNNEITKEKIYSQKMDGLNSVDSGGFGRSNFGKHG